MEKNEQTPLTRSLILLLSITCGVVVANMYYIQPIGTKVATSLSVSTSAVGILTMLTQLGYALGLLFLVPLGDVVDRPKLIIRMAALSAISLLVIFVLNGSSLISIVLITALAGALVGFLPFNFTPAKTFLGDTGSNFLGFSLAVISILGSAKTYTAAVIVLPLIALGLPIFDTVWAIIRRLIKGKSIKAIFKADKGHLHHRLVARGFSQKQAVLILYGISAIFGMFAVILCDSGIWKALSFLLIMIVAVALGYKNFSVERTGNEQYECTQCKYIYNPKFGNEKAGIAKGTKFDDLPEDWVCPVCGEGKDMFQIHE